MNLDYAITFHTAQDPEGAVVPDAGIEDMLTAGWTFCGWVGFNSTAQQAILFWKKESS